MDDREGNPNNPADERRDSGAADLSSDLGSASGLSASQAGDFRIADKVTLRAAGGANGLVTVILPGGREIDVNEAELAEAIQDFAEENDD